MINSCNINLKDFGKNIYIAGLVSLFMDISSEMIYPLVPLFLSNVLGVNKSVIGLIEGIAEATASMLRVLSGWLSDRTGNRKLLMTIGYGISTFSRPLIAAASSWHHILISRFIDRFGKGIRTAPRDAVIAESADAAFLGRAFSLHRSMDTLGAVIGPGLAFLLLWLSSNNYRMVFWLSMIPGMIAVLLIIFFITEKKKSKALQIAKPRLTFRLFDWKFRFFVLIVTIFAMGNSSDVFLILRAQQLGIRADIIPVVYLFFNLIYSISAIPAGIIADRFGKKRVMLSGLILFALVYYGFAVASDGNAVWLLFALYGIFMGLTEGIQKAFLATIIPPEFKATAFGIYTTAVGIAIFPANLAGGWLWDNVSAAATFYYGAFTALISALLFVVFITVSGKSPPGSTPAAGINNNAAI